MKYGIDLLKTIVSRDNCIINLANYKLLNRNVKIKFTCHCGIDNEKTFRTLFENGGAFCVHCTKINKENKKKLTNMEIYGSEYATQTQNVKEKIKKTNLKIYGVEFPSQNEENYGVENPMQNKQN